MSSEYKKSDDVERDSMVDVQEVILGVVDKICAEETRSKSATDMERRLAAAETASKGSLTETGPGEGAKEGISGKADALTQMGSDTGRTATAYQDMASIIGGTVRQTEDRTTATNPREDIGSNRRDMGRMTRDGGSGRRATKAEDDDDTTAGANALMTLTGHIGDDNQYDYKAVTLMNVFSWEGKVDIRDLLFVKYSPFEYDWIFGDSRYFVPR